MTCLTPVFISGHLYRCGRCVPCRVQHADEWAIRLLHEFDAHDKSIFITLTYDDEHLPPNKSLVKRDFVNWIKRLREFIEPDKLRYYGCGEYGDNRDRPHYHAILFGLGFEDFDYFYFGKKKYWRHQTWQDGNIYLGTVTYQSCRYVAKYIMKSYNGKVAEDVYGSRERPFQLCSKGIGRSFADKEALTIMRNLSINYDGKERSIPRYYVKRLKINTLALQFKAYDEFWKKYGKWYAKTRRRDKRIYRETEYARAKRDSTMVKVNELISLSKIKKGKL